MTISIKSHTTQNLFRYSLNCTLLSSFPSKTLNPNTLQIALPSNSVLKISSFCHSSSGPSLFFSSESYLIRIRPSLGVSPSRPSSVSSFGLQSSRCFPSATLPIKNQFLVDSSSWFSSRCKIESHSSCENLPVCYYSLGPPSKICSLRGSYFQSLHSVTLLTHNVQNVCSNSGCLHCGKMVRYYSISSSNGTFSTGPVVESEVRGVANTCSKQPELEERNNFRRKFVLEILDILRHNGEDVECRLNVLHSRLSIYSIAEIFEGLNSQRISGLRFFQSIRRNNPQLRKSAYICCLIIDNLGRLDDYGTMDALFKKFTSEKICLSYEAFRFLPVIACTDSSLKESTNRVVDLLKGVGGSCRSSGVCALIEMFCKLHLFEMARYVIKLTESKSSYYCLLIREKCRSGLTEDAYNVIREMRQANCAPNTSVYNYLLGSLWKKGRIDEASAVLDEMKEHGIPSDAITFEILVKCECTLGNMDVVHQLLDQMMFQGLEPRPSTHTCIIKTLFASEKYEAAYKYVVDLSIIYKTSSKMMYSLLANLYCEKGDLMSARNTLVEMMEKRMKPNFSTYIKIVKQLRRTGRANLATDLESRHSKFVMKSHAGFS